MPSMTVEVPIEGPVSRFDFKQLQSMGIGTLGNIVKDYGVVYVTAITRDGCSGCEEQKPLFRQLAQKIVGQRRNRAKFSDIHIRYVEGDEHESEQAKTALHHGSYPTYIVHVKSRFGPLEHYSAAYPSMEELERHIVDAFELAEYYQTDARKSADSR